MSVLNNVPTTVGDTGRVSTTNPVTFRASGTDAQVATTSTAASPGRQIDVENIVAPFSINLPLTSPVPGDSPRGPTPEPRGSTNSGLE